MIIKEIGRGVHGKVKLCVDTETNEQYAIKIVEKHARKRFGGRSLSQRTMEGEDPINPHLEKIKREIAILKKVNHPNVVGLKEVIDDPGAEKIYLVLEFMAGGEVRWRDRPDNPKPALSVDEARLIFRDVICGLEYLHHHGIVHRDIKPANLLLSADNVVKISDFGVSVFVGTGDESEPSSASYALELAKTAGSPAFFAPELCAVAMEVGAAIDMWALGVTLFCLIFGRVPFIAENEFELFHVICKQKLVFPDVREIDRPLRDLLVRLLEKDPDVRITLPEAKLHPWTTADMSNEDRIAWLTETDPDLQFGMPLSVTEEEVSRAVHGMDKLWDGFRKIGHGLQNFVTFGRRTRSFPSVVAANGEQTNLSCGKATAWAWLHLLTVQLFLKMIRMMRKCLLKLGKRSRPMLTGILVRHGDRAGQR
ncbi:kinase-like domain-containing protein [Zopfochytrium polystomum]|nr:kinase-like domain-containing protein [Zopfochytrium polystomum]